MNYIDDSQRYYLNKIYSYLARDRGNYISVPTGSGYLRRDVLMEWIQSIVKDGYYTDFQKEWLNQLKEYYKNQKNLELYEQEEQRKTT